MNTSIFMNLQRVGVVGSFNHSETKSKFCLPVFRFSLYLHFEPTWCLAWKFHLHFSFACLFGSASRLFLTCQPSSQIYFRSGQK